MKIVSGLKKWKDTIYGRNCTCYLCGCEVFGGEYFCADCAESLSYNLLYCERCGRKILQKGYCPDCRARLPAFDKARSVFVYEGLAREAVLRFKTGERWLAKAFIEAGMSAIERDFADCDFVAFVPMSESGLRQRGYNQSELLAREIAARLGRPVEELFVKERDTAEQKSLDKAERRKNLRGAFRLCKRSAVKDKTVLLADDALTTGATAETLCDLLRGAGAKKVYVFTVASVFFRAAGQEGE